MKKLILIMIVAMIPFLTFSQKRSKKNTDKETTSVKSNNSKFMVIKGVELDMSKEGVDQEEIQTNDVSLDRLMKMHVKPISKFYFSFDVGKKNKEVEELMEASESFRTMAQAVNKAGEYGWEFISSNVVLDEGVILHYYYMERK